MPHFDYTISFSSILNFVGWVGVIYVGFVKFQTRVDLVLTNQKELMIQMSVSQKEHEEKDDRRFHDLHQELVIPVHRLLGRFGIEP